MDHYQTLSSAHMHNGESPLLPQYGYQVGLIAKSSPKIDFQKIMQIHSNKVLPSSSVNSSTKGDGLYSLTGGEKIGVRTADCLPILLGDSKRTMAMAIHGGWRGLAQDIVKIGLKIFENNHLACKNIVVDLFPCIGFFEYEVGQEVVESLKSASIDQRHFLNVINYKAKNKWHVDLSLYAFWQLIESGVPAKNIAIDRRCTLSNSAKLYSYRRNGKAKHFNVSWISK